MRRSGKRGVHDFRVGDRVRLSGTFLRSTGQRTGSEGQKVFTILAIKDLGGLVLAVVDERRDTSGYTAAELAREPELAWRSINVANLTRVGTISSRDNP